MLQSPLRSNHEDKRHSDLIPVLRITIETIFNHKNTINMLLIMGIFIQWHSPFGKPPAISGWGSVKWP